MPTYSYRCTECDTAFDIKQSFSDATLTECPTCGGVLRKVFSPVGVTFNGGGFYRTDSRPKPASEGSGSSGSGSSGSGAGSGSSGSGASGSGSSGGPSSTPAKSGSKPSKPSTPAAS
ncbi:FmdB family zinc ribbon protein [Curtobacterium sp. VKM Ac-2922]|uniref:FmdB family zinc ribbon protein n=1 Tax=Curtobacterium sp. VKM Ac-2922 TaxID=2929475 RepID=UPI001FB33E0A|nr:FmdB family zinc ribbon protein [Curtobacterium sp. VKM Ac-2922]MCJ1714419.1 FmdB family transcriptional regulator [Curtobacterium sp. VKM Ac-2922]